MKKKVLRYSIVLILVIALNLILFIPFLSALTPASFCSLPEHCGTQFNSDICIRDENFENPFIVSASGSNTGDIRLVACQDAEYVSNGDSWISCLNNEYIIEIEAHDYLCIGTANIIEQQNIIQVSGQESIIECCGSESCNSDSTDGRRLTTGQSITLDRTITEVSGTCSSDELAVGVDEQGNLICEPKNPLLIGSGFTKQDCINDGGEAVNIELGLICKFSGKVCPEGWTQFENFRTTVPSENCPRQINRVVSIFNINAKYQITDSGTFLISCNYGSALCCGPAPLNVGTTTGQEFSSHEPDRITFTQGRNICGSACGAEHCRTTTAFCQAKTTEIGCT